jgi:transcription antitermination factor NusG
MDHYYKDLTGFQVGDLVRVDEGSEEYWKGKITKITTVRWSGTIMMVKNVNPNSIHFGDVFPRFVQNLKIWDPADDVNI